MSESESIENSTDFEPASLRLADFATFEGNLLQLSLVSWVSVTVATQHRSGSCQAAGSIIELSFPMHLVPPEASNDSDDDLKKVGVDLGKACQQVQLDCFTLKFLELGVLVCECSTLCWVKLCSCCGAVALDLGRFMSCVAMNQSDTNAFPPGLRRVFVCLFVCLFVCVSVDVRMCERYSRACV